MYMHLHAHVIDKVSHYGRLRGIVTAFVVTQCLRECIHPHTHTQWLIQTH